MTEYVAKFPNQQGVIPWTDQENKTWSQLISRQLAVVQGRACPSFIQGLEELGMSKSRVPRLAEMNTKLSKTGWQMRPVHGTVQVDDFFTMLSRRQFPVAHFIRVPEELDYLSQPDVFHEFFGHGPLLLNETYADFMQWYGATALKANKKGRRILGRLYWFTIEFGLLVTGEGLRILGGGILSSFQETQSCLISGVPVRQAFSLEEVLATSYDYTVVQPKYFILDSLDSLFQLQGCDFLAKAGCVLEGPDKDLMC